MSYARRLLDLPPEVLLMIIEHMDLESQIQLYRTCTAAQRLLRTPRSIAIRRSDMKNVEIFKLDGFRVFQYYIQSLDLTGFDNIERDTIQSVRSLKELRKLNISFTNLFLDDVFAMCPPKLKHLTITLSAKDNILLLRVYMMKLAITFFQRFDYIYFKVMPDFFDDNGAFFLNILQNSPRVQEFKVSYLFKRVLRGTEVQFGQDMPNFSKLTFDYNFHDHNTSVTNSIHKFDTKYLEYFIYNCDLRNRKLKVITSPFVRDVIENAHDSVFVKKIIVRDIMQLKNKVLYGHVTFIVWNKRIMDEKYLKELILRDIKAVLPSHIYLKHNVIGGVINTKNMTNVIYKVKNIELHDDPNTNVIDLKVLLRPEQKNVAVICNYIFLLSAKINVLFLLPNMKFLNGAYLKHVTCLTLQKITLNSPSWFEIFSNCHNLITLNVRLLYEYIYETNNFIGISEHMHLCKTLRNFRLVESKIDGKLLFQGLSKCTGLEVIHVACEVPAESKHRYDQIINLIECCTNLKGLVLHNACGIALVLAEKIKKVVQTFAHTQLNRTDLRVMLTCSDFQDEYSFEKAYFNEFFYPDNRIFLLD